MSKTRKFGENESSPSEIVKSSKLDLPSIFKLLELENIKYRVRHSRKCSPMVGPGYSFLFRESAFCLSKLSV